MTSSSSASASDTIAAVTDLVHGLLAKQGRPPAALAPDDSLTDAGLSSLDMVNLMLALEARFDLFIPPDLIRPSSFRSVQSISTMVDGLKAEPADAA